MIDPTVFRKNIGEENDQQTDTDRESTESWRKVKKERNISKLDHNLRLNRIIKFCINVDTLG